MRTFAVANTTRAPLPRVPFEKLARRILGAKYELSLVICGDARARALNTRHRGKTYKANVLSFPLSKTEGEIFLNMQAARREAKKYGVPFSARIRLLFVHACLHLKGKRHGKAMDRLEARYAAKV